MYDGCYFSADRLVEFGIGMAVARQMVQMFEKSMSSVKQVETLQTTQSIYYVSIDNRQVGPLDDKELMQIVNNGFINKDSLAWMPGMVAWQPVKDVPQILKLIALNPPEIPPYEI